MLNEWHTLVDLEQQKFVFSSGGQKTEVKVSQGQASSWLLMAAGKL